MNNKRVRGKNFGDDEALDLVNIVSEHKHVIENKKTNAIANSDKVSFNSCEGSVPTIHMNNNFYY